MDAGREWGGYIAKDGSFCDFKQEAQTRSPTEKPDERQHDKMCRFVMLCEKQYLPLQGLTLCGAQKSVLHAAVASRKE